MANNQLLMARNIATQLDLMQTSFVDYFGTMSYYLQQISDGVGKLSAAVSALGGTGSGSFDASDLQGVYDRLDSLIGKLVPLDTLSSSLSGLDTRLFDLNNNVVSHFGTVEGYLDQAVGKLAGMESDLSALSSIDGSTKQVPGLLQVISDDLSAFSGDFTQYRKDLLAKLGVLDQLEKLGGLDTLHNDLASFSDTFFQYRQDLFAKLQKVDSIDKLLTDHLAPVHGTLDQSLRHLAAIEEDTGLLAGMDGHLTAFQDSFLSRMDAVEGYLDEMASQVAGIKEDTQLLSAIDGHIVPLEGLLGMLHDDISAFSGDFGTFTDSFGGFRKDLLARLDMLDTLDGSVKDVVSAVRDLDLSVTVKNVVDESFTLPEDYWDTKAADWFDAFPLKAEAEGLPDYEDLKAYVTDDKPVFTIALGRSSVPAPVSAASMTAVSADGPAVRSWEFSPERTAYMSLEGLIDQISDEELVDLSWFDRYRPWVHGIISAICYLATAVWLVKFIPKLLGGISYGS